MIVKILSQGMTADITYSVGNALENFFEQPEFNSFIGISAFASVAAVERFAPLIESAKSRYQVLNLIVGIDQKGTPKEALEAILRLNINGYIFYQQEPPIFHPKIYLFEGPETSRLIIGSANFTDRGLYSNAEASLLCELSNDREEDVRLVEELKDRFKGLFDLSHPNLKQISEEVIAELVAEGLVPTQAETARKFGKTAPKKTDSTQNLLNEWFPPHLFARPPRRSTAKKTRKSNSTKAVSVSELTTISSTFSLVWQLRKLPASSVEITRSANTNPTGGLRLVQDKFAINDQVIDQTTYFRHRIFAQLDWVVQKASPLVEVAIARFMVVLLGEEIGEFPLAIRHKPSGEAKQRNYTTLISWGS